MESAGDLARTSSKKPGRPKGDGRISPVKIVRDGLAIAGYHESRRNGEKYDFAVIAGIGKVQSWLPQAPVSRSTVKRALADHLQKGSQEVLVFEEEECTGLELERQRQLWTRLAEFVPWIAEFIKKKERPLQFRALRASYEKVPQHRRANAVSNADENL